MIVFVCLGFIVVFLGFWFSKTSFFSVNSPGYSGVHIVVQAGMELIKIQLSLPPSCWDWKYELQSMAVGTANLQTTNCPDCKTSYGNGGSELV